MLFPTVSAAEVGADLERDAVGQQLADVDAARTGEAPQIALGHGDLAALVRRQLPASQTGGAGHLAAREPFLLPDLPQLPAQLLG